MEMATKWGHVRLSRAEVERRELVEQGLFFQVEEVAPVKLKEVMLSMGGQVKLLLVTGRKMLGQIGILDGEVL